MRILPIPKDKSTTKSWIDAHKTKTYHSNMHWETLKSEIVLKNEFFTVNKDKCKKADGSIVDDYYTIDRPDVAVIAAFTAKMNIVMIHQYRQPIKATDFELPAGYIEDHENDIKKAAERELLEETGYKVQNMEKIQETYASVGLMSNKVNFFIGFNAKKIQEPELDENEELEVEIMPWAKALKLLEEEKIKDLGSVAGILFTKKYLEKHA